MAKDSGKVNIHGKEYETVASRVQKFREKYTEEYGIITEIIDRDETTIVMKATITKSGVAIATGYAEENRNSSSINRTSALENCETSAIGRALAAFGMAGTEYASADEVAQAISKGNSEPPYKKLVADSPALTGMASEKQRDLVYRLLTDQGIAIEDQAGYIVEHFGVTTPLTKEGASFVIEELLARQRQPAKV